MRLLRVVSQICVLSSLISTSLDKNLYLIDVLRSSHASYTVDIANRLRGLSRPIRQAALSRPWTPPIMPACHRDEPVAYSRGEFFIHDLRNRQPYFQGSLGHTTKVQQRISCGQGKDSCGLR